MAFGDKPKRYWIIPQECLSPDDLVLGSILKYPNDPIDILNRGKVEPVDPLDILSEREQVTKSFTDALNTGFGSKVGASSVLAAVLGASPFIEGNWSKGTSFTIEATNVRAQHFTPSPSYVNRALRTRQVDAFVRESFFYAPIYMVVGVTVAKTMSRKSERSRDRGGGAGLGIGPPGLGLEVSGELTANHETQSSYQDSVDEDVVLAYRLRRFRYSKRKDGFKGKKQDEISHVHYSLPEKMLRSGEPIDVVAEFAGFEEDEEDQDSYVPAFSRFEGDDIVASDVEMAGFVEGDPKYEKVEWHNDSDKRVSRYLFSTKTRDHMFCPKCGASIGIDFGKTRPNDPLYGISVRQFNNIDLDSLRYEKFDGMHKLGNGVDLSGTEIDPKTGEPLASAST